MTTYSSDAVNAGIMPDFRVPAGVVLTRHVLYTTASDAIVSADVIRLLPIPKNARVIDVVISAVLPAGCTGCDVGYGGDPDAFFDGLDLLTTAVYNMSSGAVAGFLHKFTADDTIDLTLNKAVTKIPTSTIIYASVTYKMTDAINDEA